MLEERSNLLKMVTPGLIGLNRTRVSDFLFYLGTSMPSKFVLNKGDCPFISPQNRCSCSLQFFSDKGFPEVCMNILIRQKN